MPYLDFNIESVFKTIRLILSIFLTEIQRVKMTFLVVLVLNNENSPLYMHKSCGMKHVN